MQVNRSEANQALGRKSAPEPAQPQTSGARMAADVLIQTVADVAEKAKPAGGFAGLTKAFDFVVDKVVTPVKNAIVDHVIEPGAKFLMWSLMDVDKAALNYQTERDPSDVNHPRDGELANARTELKRNAEAERTALAKLNPDDRRRYEALSAQVMNRPMSQRALQTMLLERRLPGTLLAQFETMLSQPVAGGIDRAQLLGETLCEVEDPVRIAQHGKGTCGAGTAQILLARQNPAEYVRLVNGLASPKGEITMRGGAKLTRKVDWADDNDGGRSLSSRLVQPAFMEYAGFLSSITDYDNSEDKHKIGSIPLFSGLLGWGEANLLDQLTGKNYENLTPFRWNRESHWTALKLALKESKGPVPVAMTWGDQGSGHFIQVDKVENGRVYFTNPWGEQGSSEESEFKRHITQMMLPKS
jgi:hypothetical protein